MAVVIMVSPKERKENVSEQKHLTSMYTPEDATNVRTVNMTFNSSKNYNTVILF